MKLTGQGNLTGIEQTIFKGARVFLGDLPRALYFYTKFFLGFCTFLFSLLPKKPNKSPKLNKLIRGCYKFVISFSIFRTSHKPSNPHY
jgi:hypothetical protein